MSEKQHSTVEHGANPEALEAAGDQLREDLERSIESNQEKESNNQEQLDEVRHEALEQAKSKEEDKAQPEAEKDSQPKRITKQDVEQSYQHTMSTMRSHLSKPSRAFSKVIHNPVVEKTSEAVGNTVARPNLIIAGAIGAIASVVVYFVARSYGYALSGFETIGLFILGWGIGAIIEFARVGLTKKR